MKQYRLRYIKVLTADPDVPFLMQVHALPSISRFIAIDSATYFAYVTNTDHVFYYKVILENEIVASVHLEYAGTLLYMSILTLPQHQNHGIARQILEDVKSGELIKGFQKILVAIDKENMASIRLFEKAGFVFCGEADGLRDYSWVAPNT